MYHGPLKLERLEHYFEQRRLGIMRFPNGECLDEPAVRKVPAKYGPFRTLLLDVYKSITGWNETGEKVLPLSEVLGVIAFGDSIRIPDPQIRRKYLNLFGPEIVTNRPKKIHTTHSDLLIVTEDKVDYKPKEIKPERYVRNSADIELGGIRTHLATREELRALHFSKKIEKLGNPGTDGIVIFQGNENLEDFLLNDEAMPHSVTWIEGEDGFLDGYVDFDFD